MNIHDIMSRNIQVACLNASVSEAAQLMADTDLGFLPIVDADKLVGVITDRDIVTRAVAGGLASRCHVSDIMTSPVETCTEDDTVETVVLKMGDQQLRRMPVVDAGGNIVGVVALADLARREHANVAAAVLKKVTQQAGEHNQRAFHHTAFGN